MLFSLFLPPSAVKPCWAACTAWNSFPPSSLQPLHQNCSSQDHNDSIRTKTRCVTKLYPGSSLPKGLTPGPLMQCLTAQGPIPEMTLPLISANQQPRVGFTWTNPPFLVFVMFHFLRRLSASPFPSPFPQSPFKTPTRPWTDLRRIRFTRSCPYRNSYY